MTFGEAGEGEGLVWNGAGAGSVRARVGAAGGSLGASLPFPHPFPPPPPPTPHPPPASCSCSWWPPCRSAAPASPYTCRGAVSEGFGHRVSGELRRLGTAAGVAHRRRRANSQALPAPNQALSRARSTPDRPPHQLPIDASHRRLFIGTGRTVSLWGVYMSALSALGHVPLGFCAHVPPGGGGGRAVHWRWVGCGQHGWAAGQGWAGALPVRARRAAPLFHGPPLPRAHRAPRCRRWASGGRWGTSAAP
jgi:hypothetical protein